MKMIAAAAAVCIAGQLAFAAEENAEPRKIIAIFDFKSFDDDDALGKWVADNIRERTVRKGLYVMIETIDLYTAIDAQEFVVEYESPLNKIADFAREHLGCDLAMWGRVDRQGDALIINVKVVTTDAEKPELVLDDKLVAENRYVTQLAVKEMLRRLAGEEEPKEEYDPAWDKAWEEGPNLVKNPEFEEGDDSPAHWDRLNGRDYHHNMVSWVDAPGADGRGKCIKFDMDADVAGSYGVAYYSEPIDTSEGTRYRFSVRVLSLAPAVKVFLKHYAYLPPRGNEKEGQWRETRRAPLNCRGAGPTWKAFTRDFNPRLKAHGYNTAKDLDRQRAEAHDPKVTKIDLYAYWPAGVVYFDDVVLKRLE